jgi:quercetin dioxygenase-like cupin family protein
MRMITGKRYILEGEMTVHDGKDGKKVVSFGNYAAQKLGVMHGLVSTKDGCMMINFCWYPD